MPRPVPAEQAAEVWTDEPPPPRRSSILPLLIGLVILLLLALIGYGMWLALRPKASTPAPVPTPTPSAAATSRSATPSASPPAPTTTRPRPATVTVPPVTGLPVDAATAALDQLGLRWTIRRVDDQGTPGTVIRTDPDAGTEVGPGSLVTLFVAKAPPATSAPASPSTTPGD